MTQELHEQISAFIDDELPEAEAELLVRRLATDAGLRGEMARMLRLSQAIRGETSVAGDRFASRVHAAIHDEPALDGDAGPTAAVARGGRRGGWVRMAAGGGIVASVAALALLALPDAERVPDAAPVAAEVDRQQPAGLARSAEPFEYTVPAEISNSGLVSADPELAGYFFNHTVTAPSIAPGSGRARMLSDEAMPEPAAEPESAR